jgi:integrase
MPQQSRARLDASDLTIVEGLRHQVILSLGLQVGLRRSKIVRLKVRDLPMTFGCEALRITSKWGKRDVIAIPEETAQRLPTYLEVARHGQALTTYRR